VSLLPERASAPFLGADITFKLQNLSMSNLSFLSAGLWVTNGARTGARRGP
jgi:hypothetical protein